MAKKIISIVTPVFNEEANIPYCYDTIKTLFEKELPGYDYEHVFCDNCSLDKSLNILKELARNDKRVKVIANSRNFGPNRSIFNGIISSTGDATIPYDCDMQDPADLIPKFIEKWEEGFEVVYGIRDKRRENFAISAMRKLFYWLINMISHDFLPRDAGDFRLIDRRIREELKKTVDNEPYFRGLVAVIGFNQTGINYNRLERKHGKTSTNLFSLLNYAMNGIVKHSSAPLRLMTLVGFFFSVISILFAIVYLYFKIFHWHDYQIGFASLIITLFVFFSVQFLFFGLLGEYVSAIFTEVRKRPLVIERERVNFD